MAKSPLRLDEADVASRCDDQQRFAPAEPRRVESRLSVGAGGMQLSESEVSDTAMHEPFVDEPQRPGVVAGAAGSSGTAVLENEVASVASVEAARMAVEKKEVKAPHGWPSVRQFPSWYWRRLTGFDQSLDVYGFYPSWDQLIAFVFVCVTLVLMGLIEHYGFYPLVNHSLSAFLPAFGATCTVVFAVPKAPIAQPRNVIVAHVTAAIIGIALTNAFRPVRKQPFGQHCAGAIGVALHLVLMMFTNTMHPPASATVISAATSTINAYYKDEGFLFVITPVLFGAVFTSVCAWLLNNLVPSRSPYPQYW